MLVGLNLAWSKSYRRVFLESDSKRAVDLVNKGCSRDHPAVRLIQRIQDLKKRNWDVRVNWIYREGNEAVNWLAGNAMGTSLGLQIFEEPPDMLKPILLQDLGSGGRHRWALGLG